MPNIDQQDDQAAEMAQLVATVEQLKTQVANAEMRLQEMGIADSVTGLFSQQYFWGRASEEIVRADRFQSELSCLVVGLDQPSFEALIELAHLFKDSSRQYDIPARWGKNDLVMLLPATDSDGVQTFAERFRLKVQDNFLEHPTLKGLTVSIGIATYPRSGIDDARRLVDSAAAAYELALRGGGNQTVMHQ